VVQASKFELVINHQTARMQGLTVPTSYSWLPTRWSNSAFLLQCVRTLLADFVAEVADESRKLRRR
jgi:hypothetical protein